MVLKKTVMTAVLCWYPNYRNATSIFHKLAAIVKINLGLNALLCEKNLMSHRKLRGSFKLRLQNTIEAALSRYTVKQLMLQLIVI